MNGARHQALTRHTAAKHKQRGRWQLIALALLLSSSLAPALTTAGENVNPTTLRFNSGDHRVDLLELYTSEGCSSCPPADAWLGTLMSDADLWRRIVPVAFHVDYWNDLGWIDPYSSLESSLRQRRYQSEGGVQAVYTPGFVLNGNEWRGWFSGQKLPLSDATAGVLQVDIDGTQINAIYREPNESNRALELQVALLGFDLSTKVPSGENRGKELTHQFVVLAHTATASDQNAWRVEMPRSPSHTERRAIAVWVTQPGKQQPLQATGGWLH